MHPHAPKTYWPPVFLFNNYVFVTLYVCLDVYIFKNCKSSVGRCGVGCCYFAVKMLSRVKYGSKMCLVAAVLLFCYAQSRFFKKKFFMKNASWKCVGFIIRTVVMTADMMHWIACRLLLFSACFFPVLSTVPLSWFPAESERVKAYGSRMLCAWWKMPGGMEWERGESSVSSLSCCCRCSLLNSNQY